MLACFAAVALSACGRFGVDLLPLPARDAGTRDAAAEGGAPDTGTRMDSGTANDATVSDAGLDSGPAADGGVELPDGGLPDGGIDGGPPDSGPPPCPTACENPNGTASCETGTCVVSCETGYADCDGTPTNGCESNISSEAPTCGSCMTMCTNTNGTADCSAGLCAPMCSAGFADCDADPVNGCETSTTTVTDCGTCGTPCSNANGTTSCASGTCIPTCVTGYDDCDGDPNNGCETNTDDDPLHCGGCGMACGVNMICVDGGCQASPCPAGLGECDGNLADFCETNVTSSTAHCGFCGNACTTANGTPGCSGSACRVSSCNTGFGNCDNAVPNGCEVNLRTSTAHCGACGAGCTSLNGTTSCAASVCVPSCNLGFGDCDSSRPNGCETALNSVSHCGMCGRTCPAVTGGTPVCNAGICGANCNLTGTWALKITHPTSWAANSNLRSGSGNHVYWLRLIGTHSGNNLSAQLLECGRRVPPFSASSPFVNESYLFEIPNTVFDRTPAVFPTVNQTITLGNTSPAAGVTMPLTAFMLGATMSNPTTAAWPSSATNLTSVDMDGDGIAGVRINYRDDSTYDHPRAGGNLSSPRSSNPDVATRLVFSVGGALTSCTTASGAATVTQINTRIFECRLSNENSCSDSQANFLDQNCLVYTNTPATYEMTKIAANATCAAVRSALP